MAEEQKTTIAVPDLPREETAAVPTLADPVATETAPLTEAAPIEDAAPVDATAEDKKVDIKPVEEGYLGHKAQGASFPK